MKHISSATQRKGADALFLPFFEGKKPAFAGKALLTLAQTPLKVGDFSGKAGEALVHYPGKGKEKRIVLIGLGKEKDLTAEGVRIGFGKGVSLVKKGAKSLNIQIPETKKLSEEEVTEAVSEGVLLSSYVFDTNKSKKEKAPSQFTYIGGDRSVLKRSQVVSEAVCYTRDLVIQNADEITPTYLGQKAKELGKNNAAVKVKVLGRAQIVKEKLGLLEAVSRGSTEEPALIIAEYRGAAKNKPFTALVGKGITYDTGGLNLKPTGGIETMRDDMGGGGAVLGTLRAVIALKLKINLVVVIASTENAIGPKSYKPGDVYEGYSGVKVEVTNTDAEGRLVLADALSYVQKNYSPRRVVNIATLTGGAIVSLGEAASAIMSNDDQIAKDLAEAGEKTYERVWRLPLFEEYRKLLESKVADIKNSGVRKASAIQGGIFLERFIEKTAWAHIDIAGTAFPDSRTSYQPVQATGVGVRLLTRFLEDSAN